MAVTCYKQSHVRECAIIRVITSDRTQTAIIAHYAVPNAKPSTVDHV